MNGDCGPRALKVIFDHYHRQLSLSEITDRCRCGDRGTSLFLLLRILREEGFAVSPIRIPFSTAQKQPLPAIVFLDNCHFSVINSISASEVLLGNLAGGIVRLSNQDFCQRWLYRDGKGILVRIRLR